MPTLPWLLLSKVSFQLPVLPQNQKLIPCRLCSIINSWEKRQQKLFSSNQRQSPAEQAQFDKDYEALQGEREKIVRDERTGFVWVMYRK